MNVFADTNFTSSTVNGVSFSGSAPALTRSLKNPLITVSSRSQIILLSDTLHGVIDLGTNTDGGWRFYLVWTALEWNYVIRDNVPSSRRVRLQVYTSLPYKRVGTSTYRNVLSAQANGYFTNL